MGGAKPSDWVYGACCLLITWLLVGVSSAAAQTPITHEISGTQSIAVPPSLAPEPRLLLVRQLSIDASILCDGQEHGSPLGRVGLEAWVIEKGAACSVRARLPDARAGRIELSVIALDAPVLGGNLKFWRRYSSMLMRDQELFDVRQESITALSELLVEPQISESLKLSLNLAIAHLLRKHGQHEKALQHYANAEALATDTDPERAPIFNGAGLSQLALGQPDLARASFTSGLKAARSAELFIDLAAAQNNLCLVAQTQDRIEEASICYQKAAQMFDEAGDPESATISLSNWAFVAQRSGDPDGALEALQEVLARRKASDKKHALALTYRKLSQLFQQLGQFDAAFENAQEAITIFKALSERDELANSYRNYARILRQAGQRARALSYLQSALDLKTTSAEVNGKLLADLSTLLPRERAIATRQLALDSLETSNDSAYVSHLNIEQARDLSAAGRLAEANSILAKVSAAKPGLLVLQARLAMAQAEWSFASNQLTDAKQMTLPLRLYRQLRDSENSIAAGVLQVRWLKATGRIAQANALLFDTAELFAQAQATSPSLAIAASMKERHRDWKDLLADVASSADNQAAEQSWRALNLLHKTPHFSDRSHSKQWHRYQLLAAQLKSESGKASASRQATWLRELDQLDMQIQQAADSGASASLRDWQAWLQRDEVLVRYVVGARKSVAFWVRTDRVEMRELPGRDALQKRLSSAAAQPEAALELAKMLLGPEQIAGTTRLWIMPDERLHALSFASLALLQAQSLKGVIVIAGEAIPSRDFAKPLPAQFGVAGLLLAGANSLPGATRSREQLAALLGERYRPVKWPSANAIAAQDVLFFAGHGWLNAAFPSAAGLSTHAPGDPTANELIHADEMHFAAAPRLIVLSACDAAGVDKFGAGLSLARAFAHAQGSLVLAPLEPIDDGLAMAFDLAFFQALERMSPEQALLEALRSLPPDRRAPLRPWQMLLAAKVGGKPATRQ